MLHDIPSYEDFIKSGKGQFDFAWDVAISYLKLVDEANTSGWLDGDDPEDSEKEEEFWEAAKQRLQNALAILQQGVEFILKGYIAKISPYILIAGAPAEWPKQKGKKAISFSDLKTIDSQDLIKTYNLFSPTSLPVDFVTKFNHLRMLRNRSVHSIDKELKVSAIEVITNVLEMHKFLLPNENWVVTRTNFLEDSPTSLLFYSYEAVPAQVSWEFFIVFSLLTSSEVKKFFKIEKKQRNYICPECKLNSGDYASIEPKYAVLIPNTPKSNQIYCFVCQKKHKVIRERCCEIGCKGNVIDEYGYCCSCGVSQ